MSVPQDDDRNVSVETFCQKCGQDALARVPPDIANDLISRTVDGSITEIPKYRLEELLGNEP